MRSRWSRSAQRPRSPRNPLRWCWHPLAAHVLSARPMISDGVQFSKNWSRPSNWRSTSLSKEGMLNLSFASVDGGLAKQAAQSTQRFPLPASPCEAGTKGCTGSIRRITEAAGPSFPICTAISRRLVPCHALRESPKQLGRVTQFSWSFRFAPDRDSPAQRRPNEVLGAE